MKYLAADQRSEVMVHAPLLRVECVIKIQFISESMEQFDLQFYVNILEVFFKIAPSWDTSMGNRFWVVLEWNIKKLHEGKHVILQSFKVYEKVIVHCTWEAEPKSWLEVLIVDMERKFCHKLQKLRESWVNVGCVVSYLVCYPIFELFSTIFFQDIGFQSIREASPQGVIQRSLQLVAIGTQKSFKRISDNGKFVIVFEFVYGFLLCQIAERVDLASDEK